MPLDSKHVLFFELSILLLVHFSASGAGIIVSVVRSFESYSKQGLIVQY